MEFEIVPTFQYNNRKAIYLKQEHSFDMDISLFSDFTILLGCSYLGLDISLSSLQVVSVSGFCPSENWIKKPLSTPNATVCGTIKIISTLNFCEGTGTDLFDESIMYYDVNSKWCYVEGMPYICSDTYVAFGENVIFSLRKNLLIGMWIRLEHLDD